MAVGLGGAWLGREDEEERQEEERGMMRGMMWMGWDGWRGIETSPPLRQARVQTDTDR
jgi:hypothetical protein